MTRLVIHRRAFLGAVMLWPAAASLPAGAAPDAAVLEPIQQLVAGLLQIMKAGQSTPFPQRCEMLGPVVDAAFDLPTVLQESVGPLWQTMSGTQQTALKEAFRQYTLASYVNSFDTYSGQRFEVLPDLRPVGNGEQVVQTRIIPRSGDGHELDYVMRQVPTGWRAVDVLADGAVSRVAVQRSDFRRLLTRGGAPALLAQLQQKTIDLSGGANG
jgi:phospholipid transport system substrate-binding protein